MKKSYRIIGFVLLACFISINRAPAQTSLILKFNDGTNKGTLLSNLNKITFSSGTMLVRKNDTSSDNFLISELNKMMFGLYSGVLDIHLNETSLAIFPCPASDFIQLKNAPVGELDMRVYSTSGSLLIQKKITGSQPMNIANLTKGLYLLKVNNNILKFVKQ